MIYKELMLLILVVMAVDAMPSLVMLILILDELKGMNTEGKKVNRPLWAGRIVTDEMPPYPPPTPSPSPADDHGGQL